MPWTSAHAAVPAIRLAASSPSTAATEPTGPYSIAADAELARASSGSAGSTRSGRNITGKWPGCATAISNVGHADLQERSGLVPGRGGRGGKPVVALGRDRGQQSPPVTEVVGRCRVGHAAATGQVAQVERGDAIGRDRVERGVEEGATEVAVVVGHRLRRIPVI